ncbi:unnamed protein product [Phaedon cochleariae]|uniref:Scavenger receptor class B member 1 n=1 Tax=Phaedon cochleariae TaxID=80249 RepID=A0A9N9X354_PHACE|nr:unnamed protein product [Phaedon cochleariae]
MVFGEDNVSNGQTEDSLLSSKASSQYVISKISKSTKYKEKKKHRRCGRNFLLVFGILFVILGILATVFTPYDMLMKLRIRMQPGFPPFEWWLNPPDEVILSIYVFNVTNSEEFMNGTDDRMKVQEIGPISYMEKLIHTFPVFNENGTLTYTANRTPIYLPELNPEYLLNKTIVVPNMPVLMIPTYLYDAPFFVKFSVNVMMRTLNSSPFKTTSIQNFLWNFSDPIVDLAQNLAPRLVPTKNVGILSRVYADFVDNVTVYIGPTYEERKFFLIDKYDGSEFLPNRGGNCKDEVRGATEGVLYPQKSSKTDVLRYFRKTLCRNVNLVYTNEVEKYGVTGYRYEVPADFFNRTFPEEDDCYKSTPTLPDGLSDLSPCYYDTAIATSFPHFLHGSEEIKKYVDGLEPDPQKHRSYIDLEPETGIPMYGGARAQLNLVVKDMKGFNDKIRKFSNIAIPLLWLEYVQKGLPWYIEYLIYFQVVLLPIIQVVFSVVMLILGSILMFFYIRKMSKRKENLARNKMQRFETETFLKPQ